ncbi:NUDIX domain-containing protein [Streptomyces sp. NPDC001185]|uniref:NUDIX domain-containing protein n=1 Tax=Streptomyces sp. NPDC001185 TaxID=3154380 RepID=UPI00331F77D1
MAVDGLIAGAVVVRAGRVLMIRRAVPVGGLVWQFPAGRVEAGESAAEAAAREASEETGVRVEPVSVIGGRVHPETGRRVVYVACRWVSGEPWAASPREVAEAVWVPSAEVAERIPGGVFGPVRRYLDEATPR